MDKQKKKKSKIRINNPKRLVFAIGILILIIVGISIKNNTIKKKQNLSVIINNEDVTSKLENEIIIRDEAEYLSLKDIEKCLEASSYQEENKIIITTKQKISVLELNKNEIEINGSTIKIPVQAFKTDKGIIYLPISELKNVYDIEFLYVPEYKNIIIDSYSKRLEKAYITKDTLVKKEKNVFSDSIEKVQRGDWISYISQEGNWAKIRTQNGNIGYIKKKRLTKFEIEREEMLEEQVKTIETNYKKDITNKDLEKYEARKKIIEEILTEAVEKNEKVIKIIYKKDKEKESFKRFKIESITVLKECGITVLFE